jgi:hypothetical protein
MRRTRVNQYGGDEAAAGAATGAAAGAAARTTCDVGTLRGTYLVAYDGVDTKGPDKGPFALAELEWYDGKGNIRGIGSENFNGDVTSPPQQFSGTYTVNADCTGTSTYPGNGFNFEYDLFIDPGGDMFTFVQTNPKEKVASGVEKRVTLQRVGD